MSSASDTVVEQWTEIAREQNLPEAVVKDVGMLLEHTLSSHDLTTATMKHPNIRDSLRRFISEFRHAFSSQQNSSEFSYYFVWLVAEAVRRGPADEMAFATAREDLCRCMETFAERMRNDFRERVGTDFAKKYEKQIEAGIEWTRAALMHQFEVLQADPLFPSFKRPFGSKAIDIAVRNASRPDDYELEFKAPLRMMVPEEQIYVERLENFFKYRPRELLYSLIVEDIGGRLTLNPYWGPVEYTVVSTDPRCIWPMEVRLHVSDARRTTNTTKNLSMELDD